MRSVFYLVKEICYNATTLQVKSSVSIAHLNKVYIMLRHRIFTFRISHFQNIYFNFSSSFLLESLSAKDLIRFKEKTANGAFLL